MTPTEVPYDTLKAALIDAFGKTQAQKDQDLAKEADRIMEVSQLSNNSQVNSTLKLNSKSGRRNSAPKSDQQWPLLPGLCKYHSKFGERARSCLQPCKFHNFSGTGKHHPDSEPQICHPVSEPQLCHPFLGPENGPPVVSKQLVGRKQCTSPCF